MPANFLNGILEKPERTFTVGQSEVAMNRLVKMAEEDLFTKSSSRVLNFADSSAFFKPAFSKIPLPYFLDTA